MGEAGEGQNDYVIKPRRWVLSRSRQFRDRLPNSRIADEQLPEIPFIRFADDSR